MMGWVESSGCRLAGGWVGRGAMLLGLAALILGQGPAAWAQYGFAGEALDPGPALVSKLLSDTRAGQLGARQPGQATQLRASTSGALASAANQGQSSRSAALPAGGCLQFSRIIFNQTQLVARADLQAAAASLLGPCIPGSDFGARLNQALQAMQKLYADAGYVGVIFDVPEQDFQSGQLTIAIQERRLESITIERSWDPLAPISGLALYRGPFASSKQRRIWAAFERDMLGQPIKTKALQAGLARLNSLPSANANVEIVDGSSPQTVALVIKDQWKDRFRSSLSYQRSGAPDQVDSQSLGLALEADNLANLNDQWRLSYSGSSSSNALSASLQLPLWDWQAIVSASYDESMTPLTETADLFSQGLNTSGQLSYQAWSTDHASLTLQATGSSYWNRRYINDSLLTPQRRIKGRVAALGQWRVSEQTALSGQLGYSRGLSGLFGADKDPDPLPPLTPQAQFESWDARLGLRQSWAPKQQDDWRWSASAELQGQYSNDLLFSTDQFQIGDGGLVRGYSGASFAGEQGWALTNTLSLQAPARVPGVLALGYGLLDASFDPLLPDFADIEDALAKRIQGFSASAYLDGGWAGSLADDQEAWMVGTGVALNYNSVYGILPMIFLFSLYHRLEQEPADFTWSLSANLRLDTIGVATWNRLRKLGPLGDR